VGFDADGLVGAEPAAALKTLATHERAVAACRLRLTARAESMHQWQREGYDSFEDWLAATHGTSRGRARQRARTARKVKDRPKTARALADGEISEDEAEVVADAADKNPEAEDDLIGAAKNKGRSHKDLQDRAAKAKAAAEDDKARARRLRRDRTARWGRDRDGHWFLRAKLEPQVGAQAQRRLETIQSRLFGSNRRDGNREPRDRYAADALAELLAGPAHQTQKTGRNTPTRTQPAAAPSADAAADPATPTPAAGRATPVPAPTPKAAVLLIDLDAYRRGHVLSGDTCEIRGVGPVPVEVAMEWLDDAFIKAVITDGTDIRTVTHFGRHRPAILDTALQLRDPKCVVPRCDNTFQEWDHRIRHTDHGPCSLENLRGLCPSHHRQLTHDGYRLEGGPGRWRWIGPDGTIFADDHTRARAPARC